MVMGVQPLFYINVFLMHQEGPHRLFLYMIQGLKSTIKEEPALLYTLGQCHHYSSALHESQVSRKKDSRDSSLAGSTAHDNSDKATRRGVGLDVKDIHPVNGAVSF